MVEEPRRDPGRVWRRRRGPDQGRRAQRRGCLHRHHGDGYVELALGVTAERIDTIVDFAAAQKHGVKTDGGTAAGPGAKVLAELAVLNADGHLEVPIANVCPLAQVREAYTEVERRHTRGKIVLRP